MPALTLDHVIIGVEDLRAAADELARVLGRRPSWRGRHPSYGTANVLFRLETSYLELLAPDPEGDSTGSRQARSTSSGQAWSGSLGRFLREHGPGLFSIALRTPDVAATAKQARGRGLPVEEPLAGSGVDIETGAKREWVNARIPPESTRGTRCFYIEHRSPASALPVAPCEGGSRSPVADIACVVATSTEIDGARRMWREVFGLPETGSRANGWRYDLGNAGLHLLPEAGANGGPPDYWSLLVLRVPDLGRTRERLRASGLTAAASSVAAYEGMSVEACGARVLMTEAR